MTDRINIAVVDDHPLYRDGVVRTLQDDGAFAVVAQGSNAEDALRIAAEQRPAVMLLDISMPGNGVNAARNIIAKFPEIGIAMLTVSEADDDIMNALDAGAKGYILKGVDGDTLVGIVKSIGRGESYVAPGLAARLLKSMKTNKDAPAKPSSPLDALTAREEQILKLVADGLSNKEVGRSLKLQEKTVKHYMTIILQKLRARNRVEAAVIARGMWQAGDR